jgi:phage-related protein
VGAGTREIRIRDASQKKTRATSKRDKAIAAARYRAEVNARREKE